MPAADSAGPSESVSDPVPAKVDVTADDTTIARMRLFAKSAIKTRCVDEEKAVQYGILKEALVPVPSLKPAIVLPARVVTAPAGVTTLTMFESVTYKFPASSAAPVLQIAVNAAAGATLETVQVKSVGSVDVPPPVHADAHVHGDGLVFPPAQKNEDGHGNDTPAGDGQKLPGDALHCAAERVTHNRMKNSNNAVDIRHVKTATN